MEELIFHILCWFWMSELFVVAFIHQKCFDAKDRLE
jgi:hypothetical protein